MSTVAELEHYAAMRKKADALTARIAELEKTMTMFAYADQNKLTKARIMQIARAALAKGGKS